MTRAQTGINVDNKDKLLRNIIQYVNSIEITGPIKYPLTSLINISPLKAKTICLFTVQQDEIDKERELTVHCNIAKYITHWKFSL